LTDKPSALQRKEDEMAISIKGKWKSTITPVLGSKIFETFDVDDEPDPSTGAFTGTYHPDGAADFAITGQYKPGTGTTKPPKDHMKFYGTEIDHTGKKKTKRTFNGDVVPVGADAETNDGKHHKDILPLTKKKKKLTDPDDDWTGTHTT
jgi:hypothetical protein